MYKATMNICIEVVFDVPNIDAAIEEMREIEGIETLDKAQTVNAIARELCWEEIEGKNNENYPEGIKKIDSDMGIPTIDIEEIADGAET
jgi:hypothetical protein